MCFSLQSLLHGWWNLGGNYKVWWKQGWLRHRSKRHLVLHVCSMVTMHAHDRHSPTRGLYIFASNAFQVYCPRPFVAIVCIRYRLQAPRSQWQWSKARAGQHPSRAEVQAPSRLSIFYGVFQESPILRTHFMRVFHCYMLCYYSYYYIKIMTKKWEDHPKICIQDWRCR